MADRPTLAQRLARRLLGVPSAAAAPPGASVPRADATLPAAVAKVAERASARGRRARQRLDAIRNTFVGYGDDKITAGRPDTLRLCLSDQELDAIWRFGGTGRRFVEVMPSEATKKGWTVDTEAGDALPHLDAEHKRLQLVQRVHEADCWARLKGGAYIMPVVDEEVPAGVDPRHLLRTPLDPSRVLRVRNLVVYEKREVTPARYGEDPRSRWYRRPDLYTVHPSYSTIGSRVGVSTVDGFVHASRLIYFGGALLTTDQRRANNGTDDSVLQAVWDQIRNYEMVSHGLAALAAEMRITVLRMRELEGMSVSDEAEYFDLRMRKVAQHKGILNMVLLGEGEEYAHHPGTVTGTGEMVNAARQDLQAVTGMPEQLWIGNAPGGLSTDGDSHRRLWASVVESYQVVRYTPPLGELYTVILAARHGPWGGQVEKGWQVGYRPLDEETQAGKATLRKTVAETDAIYIAAGVLDPQHVAKSRFGERGWQFELLPVDPDGFGGAGQIDLTAVLAALAEQGAPPEQLSGATPAGLPGPVQGTEDEAADDTDASLADRRRLAREMTDAGVTKCEHGSRNRCRLCGVERRRKLERDGEGNAVVDDEGNPVWSVLWAAMGDYLEAEEPQPSELQSVLESVAASRGDGQQLTRHDLRRVLRAAGHGAQWGPHEHQRRDAADSDKVSVWVGIPWPNSGMPAWESARLAAANIVGTTLDAFDLRGHGAHVTVLWVGKVPRDEVATTQARVIEAVDAALSVEDGQAGMRQIRLAGRGLDAFEPSAASEGDTPIFIALDSSALEGLHEVLSQKLLTDAQRRERHWYCPHLTLGYLPGELTSDQRGALWEEPTARASWMAERVQLSVGGEVVHTWTLAAG